MLNGGAADPGIRECMRAAVLSTADRLGYIPITPPAACVSSANVLTLLVQDLANSCSCFVDIAVAARAAAVERGYEVNGVDAGPFQAEMRALEHLRGGNADAVIVATGRHASRGPAIKALRNSCSTVCRR